MHVTLHLTTTSSLGPSNTMLLLGYRQPFYDISSLHSFWKICPTVLWWTNQCITMFILPCGDVFLYVTVLYWNYDHQQQFTNTTTLVLNLKFYHSQNNGLIWVNFQLAVGNMEKIYADGHWKSNIRTIVRKNESLSRKKVPLCLINIR